MKEAKLPLVIEDEWLEPVNQYVNERYKRYAARLKQISDEWGSLSAFAQADRIFGLNYDRLRKGWWYREWAPSASALFLSGDFNNWQRYSNPLINNGKGIWEIFLDDKTYKLKLKHKSLLKVIVQSNLGETDRIPVYIKRVMQDETTKDFCGQLWNPPKAYRFAAQKPQLAKDEPLLIYEAHVGMAQEKAGVGSYNEFRINILPKIANAGYNAVQLMAIAEHPYYGSFGYHVSNFFAPSSRFGTPEELKMLIDAAHELGLLVIMDIVHSHTVKNTREGLNLFDGTDYQYTHAGGRGEHPQWDSKLFNYGKTEVLQFLLSNVRYWLTDFQFDGYRFDGITSMLYLHHGNGVQFDHPFKYFAEGVDYDAVTYLQLANTLVHDIHPHAISIAEDVSGMPGLCHPIPEGGMGFDYRLGMGLPDFWIKLLKEKADEDWNGNELYHTMTNRLFTTKTIAYAESHDQALVGDKTLAFRLMDKEMYDSMAKDRPNLIIDRGLALHKMIRLFTISLGGEAWLNFMGNEFGHPEWIDFPREGNKWSYEYARRQWSLVEKGYLKYHWLADFDRAMIGFVRHHNIMLADPPYLLQVDDDGKTIVFERNHFIFVFNWHPRLSTPDYSLRLKESGTYRVVLTTDDKAFGGFGRVSADLDYPSQQITGGETVMKIYNVNRTATVFFRVGPAK